MSEANATPSKTSTDITALAGGVIGAAITLFVTPGEYGYISLLVSLTLVIIILGQVWPLQRSWPQSLGLAVAIALVSLGTIGTFVEAAKAAERNPSHEVHTFFSYLAGTYEWQCEKVGGKDPCEGKDGGRSSEVLGWHMQLGWVVIMGITFAADRVWQRKRQS
ncbi:MAG TPA: hypothetical protein VEK73_06650 [Xanthobacteraceae bacterium]|nr:hypothetical protein [Xanthobacteraceae bacterium]